MAYSAKALQYASIGAAEQVRLTDRVSYLYLEYAQIVQGRTGVLALQADENGNTRGEVQIPVGSIAVVMLGPGTSITAAAAASLAAAGAVVMFTGGGGVYSYATARPLTTSARWAEAQAYLWASRTHRVAAARVLYQARLGKMPIPVGARLATLRGLEGQMMRAEYRRLAIKHGVKFKRDTLGTDPVNIGLNLGNGILYGVAASVASALSLNPALGVIHQGDARALLYDLADVYKQAVTLPIAFASSKEKDPTAYVRKRVRAVISQRDLLDEMLALTMRMLSPHLSGIAGDVLLDDQGTVEGHTNYATDAGTT
ncbi:type I-E CRISPR-associated endonuclease Cas1 [Cryobacterium frigoriphilum]|uniref:CRISPR-associated endonuclease Cas1 n=1 Tax=Cryobacterium frigoriphilum TaxID=1259150 RepID=A0A4V3IQG4_9MICO|nr:CRISPR-associated endonuclease Cas1 [Cryobacterium frigoriphilum]TFD45941.1 type I-E CRISPR-associated endonuclease Cas1 [Cryobacterium frigoriphilum]